MNRFLARILAPLIRKGEGDSHPGPWQLPISGGWLPAGVGDYFNWWQMGFDPVFGTSSSAIVEACVSAYAQTIAMCPGDHWKSNSKGGRTRIANSALSRILRYPNDYQSISDFMMNMTRGLYLNGNAYALALRNDRYEVDELHMMNPDMCRPLVAETGDIFYQLAGNDVIANRVYGESSPMFMVPMRDVLHIRLNINRQWPRPLLGTSPLDAALQDIGLGAAITNQQMKFYMNEARPSAVLSTDLVLDKEQVQQLRDRWDEQSKGLRQGGTPILTAGLKVNPWGSGASGRESAIADIAKMSKENIALAFRVPLQILGIGGTPYSSVETLMQSWIASGLGFALNHIEEAFGVLFNLRGPPDEYVEFDTGALLRSAHKDRIESLARGVQGGIYAPNEARAMEGLDEVKYGDEPRVQQQVVPLSAAANIPPKGTPPGITPPTPSPDAPPAPPPAPAPKGNRDDIQREVRNLLAAADRVGRRLSS
jgi:HK97 family phage portal protein